MGSSHRVLWPLYLFSSYHVLNNISNISLYNCLPSNWVSSCPIIGHLILFETFTIEFSWWAFCGVGCLELTLWQLPGTATAVVLTNLGDDQSNMGSLFCCLIKVNGLWIFQSGSTVETCLTWVTLLVYFLVVYISSIALNLNRTHKPLNLWQGGDTNQLRMWK